MFFLTYALNIFFKSWRQLMTICKVTPSSLVKATCWEILEKTAKAEELPSVNKILPKLSITNIMVSHADMSLGSSSHSSRVSNKNIVPQIQPQLKPHGHNEHKIWDISALALYCNKWLCECTEKKSCMWATCSRNISQDKLQKADGYILSAGVKNKTDRQLIHTYCKYFIILWRHVDISVTRIRCSCSCLLANLKCHTCP